MNKPREIIFLIGEDDDDDFFLIEKALKKDANDKLRVIRAKDGKSLLTILVGHAEHSEPPAAIVVLLDLNMPKADGRQALHEIKSHPKLKKIPTIILTTSQAREDIERCYALGSNAYFIKPSSFSELQEMISMIGHCWLKVAEVPVA